MKKQRNIVRTFLQELFLQKIEMLLAERCDSNLPNNYAEGACE